MITTVLIADVVLKVVSAEIQVSERGQLHQMFWPLKKMIFRKTKRFQSDESKNDIRDHIKAIFRGIQCFQSSQ